MTTTRPWWAGLQLAGLRAFCIALIALNSFRTRTRMSHENGIVARGRVRIVDDLAIPENDFFGPGREFPCRLRHASVSLMDDAGLFVRAASLKFADADIESPLDLLMNGGTASPFWNMYTFAQFMFARMRGGRAHLIPYFQANPRCFENVVSALRLRPTSFSQLRYHTQTPFEFRARDGRLRYCKFRLLPEDRGPETGIPTKKTCKRPGSRRRIPARRCPRIISRTSSANACGAEARNIISRCNCTSGSRTMSARWSSTASMPGTRARIPGCPSPLCTSTRFTRRTPTAIVACSRSPTSPNASG